MIEIRIVLSVMALRRFVKINEAFVVDRQNVMR